MPFSLHVTSSMAITCPGPGRGVCMFMPLRPLQHAFTLASSLGSCPLGMFITTLPEPSVFDTTELDLSEASVFSKILEQLEFSIFAALDRLDWLELSVLIFITVMHHQHRNDNLHEIFPSHIALIFIYACKTYVLPLQIYMLPNASYNLFY